uniref:Uncharacterized protein n=1 Tax=Oryza punctata TaxID=4537 RepID=A0A0E0LID4_ORYPU
MNKLKCKFPKSVDVIVNGSVISLFQPVVLAEAIGDLLNLRPDARLIAECTESFDPNAASLLPALHPLSPLPCKKRIYKMDGVGVSTVHAGANGMKIACKMYTSIPPTNQPTNQELVTEVHAGQRQQPSCNSTAVIRVLVGGAGNSDVQHGVIRSWWLMWVEATEPIPGAPY